MHERWRDQLRAALPYAELSCLRMVVVQVTGDQYWLGDRFGAVLEAPIEPFARRPPIDESARIELLVAAEKAIENVLDGAPPAIPRPDDELCTRMLSACVGERVPSEYTLLALEEMGLKPRWVEWSHAGFAVRCSSVKVVIIGAGLSGLCAAIHLRHLGIPFTVIEKNDEVGGTWYENSYPGCRVDVANHFYSYSFEPNPGWSDYYSRQPELHSYIRNCAEKYELAPYIRFNTEAKRADFDPARGMWVLTTTEPDGSIETLEANVLITAVGQLNRPKIPDFPGMDDFEGQAFHSARWRHDLDLSGHVGLVGTGASAMQVVPHLAHEAASLTIFQRSPQWILPNPNYHRSVSDSQRFLLEHVPYYAGWYRFSLLWALGDGLWPRLKVDPAWPDRSRSINAYNDRVRAWLTKYTTQCLVGHQELIEKALPDYPPYSKRILADNGWFRTLLRPNVELVTEPIKRVHADAVETADGVFHRVDTIVFGTGFEASKVLWPMEVRARGRVLSEVWNGDDPRAYLGIATPGFPNLFFLYGPSTNLGHGGSIIFHTECQTRYVLKCIRELVEREARTIEVRASAYDVYNAKLDLAMAQMIWSQVNVGSWYKNSRGRVVANSPWRLVDYWAMTESPDFGDWTIDGLDCVAPVDRVTAADARL